MTKTYEKSTLEIIREMQAITVRYCYIMHKVAKL